jgi:hypothetical protein
VVVVEAAVVQAVALVAQPERLEPPGAVRRVQGPA